MAFTVDQVRDMLSGPDGDYDDGLDAFVAIGYDGEDGEDELTVSLTTTEDDEKDRTTDRFSVKITPID